MKKLASNIALSVQPVPKTIVSCRGKDGRNNAFVVGFTANASLDPVMVMVGIVPSRFSHQLVKDSGCFVINLPKKGFEKEYNYLGSRSGRDEDKFAALDLKWEDAKYVNAPILTDCPVSIECSVVDSIKPGTHELFIGKVDAVHVDEQYLDSNGNILWDKMNLM
ncbi:MAG: flavin reductase family protein [Candidatus Cryptobacteroides sp.]